MIKFAFFFYFFQPVFGFSATASEPSYYDTLIQEEEIKVDCSNILEHIQSYITKNEMGQILLAVSAGRFLSEVNSCGTKNSSAEIAKLQPDVQRLSQFVNERIFMLSDLSAVIMEVLPDCLKAGAVKAKPSE